MWLVFIYLACIVLADWVAAKWIIPILPEWGVYAPAGVLFIGILLTLRDAIHDKYGWKGTMGNVAMASALARCIGGLTSGGLLQRIAVASFIAFALSESVDTVMYQIYLHLPWLKRVSLSNWWSSIVDSVVFIVLAFGWQWGYILGQIIA